MPDIKVPPHSVEAEQAVIGAMFVNRKIIPDLSKIIQPEDFYRESHHEIVKAFYSLQGDADLVSVCHYLNKAGLLEKVGGQGYLVSIMDAVSTSAGYRYHTGIVREMSMRRKLIAECAGTAMSCYSLHEEIPEIVKGHEKRLQDIEQGSDIQFKGGVHLSNIYTPDRMIEEYRTYVEDLKKNRFITGMDEIDSRIRGLAGGEVLFIIARAGCFKTAILQNMLRGYIHHSAWGVAFFSLEMPVASMTERYHEIVQGSTGREIEKFYADPEAIKYRETLDDAFRKDLERLFIIPTKVNIKDIAAYTRLIEKNWQLKIGVIGIDYLGLMDGEGRGEYEIVSNISRDVKTLAKLLNLPVIVLSQTSRKGGAGETEINMDFGRGCFDKMTQILTNKGWKYFDNLEKSDKVLTMNPNTSLASYKTPTEIIKYIYNGKLLGFNNLRSDFMVTPNHIIFNRHERVSTYKFERADTLKK